MPDNHYQNPKLAETYLDAFVHNELAPYYFGKKIEIGSDHEIVNLKNKFILQQ